MEIPFPNLAIGLVTWAEGVVHPVSTLNKFLFSDDKENSSIPLPGDFVGYFSFSIMLSLIVEVPIMQSAGVLWTNFGYQSLSFIIAFCSLFLQSATIHLFLLARGITSEFWKTFILFCSPTLAYLPLTNLLGLKGLDASFANFQEAKKLHLDMSATLQYFITNRVTLPTALLKNDMLAHLLQSVSATLGLFTITLTAEGISQYYRIDRSMAYPMVVTAGLLVIGLHVVSVSALSFMTTYAFLGVH